MKIVIGIIIVIALAIGAFMLWNPEPSNAPGAGTSGEVSDGEAMAAQDGTYTVVPEESKVTWSGKKPLIDGYVNTGTIGVTEGTITVADGTGSGQFTLDMNTLTVSETKAKPGQESTLAGHLKSDRWFDVGVHPTATFVITDVAEGANTDTTFRYDVTGDLTLKGQTHEVTFPATIYETSDGTLYASANFEIDRTQWGITSGSSAFFENLADNAISDMVALSFSLVAKQ